MTKPIDLLPIGLEDRLPASARRITLAMRAALDAIERHGYDRVRPALLEFETSLARHTQGVRTQAMFRFVDPESLRTLALRSDITPQIGRIAATALADAPRPLRLAYCGDTAIMRSGQLDPARDRLQLGAELIGADSARAAGEIADMAIEACQAVGLTGLSVDFTLPDLVETLAAQDLSLREEAADAIRRELDTKDAGGLRDAGGAAYLPLLYAAGPFDTALGELRRIDAGGALGSRLNGLETVTARLRATYGDGVRLTLDPTERYGFEYQSWFGFTLYANGVRGAVGRGGTFTIGEGKEPATGFSLYLDRLADAIAEPAKERMIHLPLGHDPQLAARMRSEGWRTLAQMGEHEDPAALGCTHVLEGGEIVSLG